MVCVIHVAYVIRIYRQMQQFSEIWVFLDYNNLALVEGDVAHLSDSITFENMRNPTQGVGKGSMGRNWDMYL